MPASRPTALGIDVGGTSIKGAVVDIDTGELIRDRVRLTTPQPATPSVVSSVVSGLAARLDFTGPTGIAFPSAISRGIVLTAANLLATDTSSPTAAPIQLQRT